MIALWNTKIATGSKVWIHPCILPLFCASVNHMYVLGSNSSLLLPDVKYDNEYWMEPKFEFSMLKGSLGWTLTPHRWLLGNINFTRWTSQDHQGPHGKSLHELKKRSGKSKVTHAFDDRKCGKSNQTKKESFQEQLKVLQNHTLNLNPKWNQSTMKFIVK